MAEEEEYLDDPIRLFDLDSQLYAAEYYSEETERSISNISINSNIVLPQQFFYISKNLKLLNKCKPLTINIVDCNKHPWYYENILNNNKYTSKSHITMNAKKVNKDFDEQKKKTRLGALTLGTKITCSNNTVLNKKNHKSGAIVGELYLNEDVNTPLTKRNKIEVDLKKNSGLVGYRIKFKVEIDDIRPRKIRNRDAQNKVKKVKVIPAIRKKTKAMKSAIDSKSKHQVTKTIYRNNDDTSLIFKQPLAGVELSHRVIDKPKITTCNESIATNSSVTSTTESSKGTQQDTQSLKLKELDNYIIKNSKDTTLIFKKVEAQYNHNKLLNKSDNEYKKNRLQSNQTTVQQKTINVEKNKLDKKEMLRNEKVNKLVSQTSKLKKIRPVTRWVEPNKESVGCNITTINSVKKSVDEASKYPLVVPNITVSLLNNKMPNKEANQSNINHTDYSNLIRKNSDPSNALDPKIFKQVSVNDIVNKSSMKEKKQTTCVAATVNIELNNISQPTVNNKELNTNQPNNRPVMSNNSNFFVNQMHSIHNTIKVKAGNTSQNLKNTVGGRPIETVLTRQLNSVRPCDYNLSHPQNPATTMILHNNVNDSQWVSSLPYTNAAPIQNQTGHYMIHNNPNRQQMFLGHNFGIPPIRPTLDNLRPQPNYNWIPSYNPYYPPPVLPRAPQPRVNYENYISHTKIPTRLGKYTKSALGKNTNDLTKINLIQKESNENVQNGINVNLPIRPDLNLQNRQKYYVNCLQIRPKPNVRKRRNENTQSSQNSEVTSSASHTTNFNIAETMETTTTNSNEHINDCRCFYHQKLARQIIEEVNKVKENIYNELGESERPSTEASNPQKQYSPPILPIPTYEKSLELLAKGSMQHLSHITSTQPKPTEKRTSKRTDTHKEHDKISKKKTISLEEYKNRAKVSPNSCVDLTGDDTKIKTEEEIL